MDLTDKRILHILAADANTTATEIGGEVGLSVPAVNKRILRLQEKGFIKSYTVMTDAKAVGKSVIAYILLALQYGEAVDNLMDCVNGDADILECYAVTGEYDYIIKTCAESIEALEEKLLRLKKQKGVIKSQTMLALMEHKFKPTILPDTDA